MKKWEDGKQGEIFLRHAEKCLGRPKQTQAFEFDGDEIPTIQVAEHNMIRGAKMFSTLGLSWYIDVEGRMAELFVPVEGEFDVQKFQKFISQISASIITNKFPLRSGGMLQPIDEIFPEFCKEYDKNGVYFSVNEQNPPGFNFPPEGKGSLIFLQALFITNSEVDFILLNGSGAFESALEQHNVDPVTLRRKSLF